MKADWFAGWLRGAQWLGTFWCKVVGDVKVLYEGVDGAALLVDWPRAKRSRGGLLIYLYGEDVEAAHRLLRRFGADDLDIILLLREGVDLRGLNPNAESIFYAWTLPHRASLEPNREVEIRVHADIDGEVEDASRSVMLRSWGFYIRPRRGLHTVVLAWLDGRPVGVAYLNRVNFNIDFGIHVARGFWRRRIGTRILQELANLAFQYGGRLMTVVRVLGRSRAGDRRAISFYRANKPSVRLRVYRLSRFAGISQGFFS